MIQSIELKERQRLMRFVLASNAVSEVSYARLRALCKCSQCEALKRAGGEPEIASDLQIIETTTLGDHGLNIRFSDGHDRGIYPFVYLEDIALGHVSG
jgi:DUF971 family protein